MSEKSLVIYRCCDRPKYVERTFPHLIENTESSVLMADNSTDTKTTQIHREIFEKHARPGDVFRCFGHRIGVWHVVYEALKWWPEHHGSPVYVMIADDDCLVPAEEHPWDYLLEYMMEHGPWSVVGCAETNDPCTPHPRDQMLVDLPWPEGRHKVRGYGLAGEGLARGRKRRFVGGACSGFKFADYLETIDPVELSIPWFNNWTAKYHGDPSESIFKLDPWHVTLEDGRCGHFAGYPITTFKHLDQSNEHLRDEYDEYTNWMLIMKGKGSRG